jgi:ribonucleoside-diphosphate reductase alpha chain
MGETRDLVGERYFSSPDVSPYDQLKWTKSDVPITDEEGKVLFVQKDVEFPEQYNGLTRKIVASRYFYGKKETPQREYSARQLVGRVTETFGKWALDQGYVSTKESAEVFKDELAFLALNQAFAWNSPVWFNVGTDRYENFSPDEQRDGYVINSDGEPIRRPLGKNNEYPQTSACFIQDVEDTMESIMDLAVREAMLFRHGSGTGTNLSTLRSSREEISGGGAPSGPLAYLSFYDRVAGIVKSGGRTRRAAKWDGLDITHPDILEWIRAKVGEQRKLNGMMDFLGISYREAADSVLYQNENITVRVTDDFMQELETGGKIKTIPVHSQDLADQMPEYDARFLWHEIAKSSWECADPGLQFDTTINDWHTTPNTARINASNPCSEYLHVDNSSCNLASLKLTYFMDKDGNFRVNDFRRAVDLVAKSQDMEFDISSFPTAKITRNSHRLRNLGLGYTDLGSLLMLNGLPYDSDEGRATAAAITSLMTGQTYLSSTEMAEKLGPFKEYEKNRDATLRVLKKHKTALQGIDRTKIPKGLEGVFDEAEKVWDHVVERAEKYGVRNAQATVLAPTGTISFQMGADTFGVEPDTGLVKYKLLAEGGVLRIVNQTVPIALQRLGYVPDKVNRIIEYISGHEDLTNTPKLKPEHKTLVQDHLAKGNLEQKLREVGYNREDIKEISFYVMGHQTAEGSEIKPEHLAVFDCASKPKHGTRYISPIGHVKMMAAVQPFLSGAISKTVNLPEKATVEDIENMHTAAWKMGLKAIAVYRQGSKRGEPLSFGGNNFDNEEKMIQVLRDRGIRLEDHLQPIRKKLPDTRRSLTSRFEIAPVEGTATYEGYLHPGFYPDGKLGEMFIGMLKEGSTVKGLTDALGVAISLGLQYGVPPDAYIKKFRHQKFEPRGRVLGGLKDINTAESIVDYLAQFMEKINGNGEKGNIELRTDSNGNDNDKKQGALGGFCAVCSGQMEKDGNCLESCSKCGWVDPKGCGQ